MLSKDDFNNCINDIVVEFQDKGFVMTQERSEKWYKFLSKYSGQELSIAVDELLLTQSFCPSFADLYKLLPAKTEREIHRAPDEFREMYEKRYLK